MKTYQESYLYRGANPDIKELASKMLVRGSGTRDIAYVLSISRNCVSNLIASYASINLKPSKEHYNQVQVDELYSFVQTKQKKVWILYASCVETKEILAVTMGNRSKKTVLELYNRLKDIQVNFWCTDHWEAFKAIFPSEKHKVGKEFTKAIEGVNTYLRGACKRLIRRTTAFSKKVLNHWAAIKLVMKHRNLTLSTI